MRKNMIKWRPFYSVPGLNKLVSEIEEEKNQKTQPTLSTDLIESINYTLKEATRNNLTIKVKHFKHGLLLYEIGKITKINTTEKYILVNNTKIYFKNIVNVTLN